jgi:hypothetical protein
MIVPALAVLGGWGLTWLASLIPNTAIRRILVLLLLVGAGYQAVITQVFFYGEYKQKSAPYWEAGFLEAIHTVEQNRQAGDICLVSGLIEFPEATIEFLTLPDPRKIQKGEPLEGYRFIQTGQPYNPLAHPDCRLFLIRPNEIRIPPWWREVRPNSFYETMQRGWKLYRSEK